MAATFKIEKLTDFTVMANHHLRNKSLSLKAKGLQSLMLSLPDGWDYTLKGLAAICRDGVDSISSALKELEREGYVVRKRKRNAKGQLTDTEYIIYQIPPKCSSENRTDGMKPKRENPEQVKENMSDEPETKKPMQEKPKRENPILDKPVQAKPVQEKRPQLNIQESNTKESNTNLINHSGKSSEEIDEIRDMIKENINYDYACKNLGTSQINGIVEIMLEVYMAEGNVTIAKQNVPAEYVQGVFDKIEYEHIDYVLDCLNEVSKTQRIKNIKKYLLTSLYNAPMTMDTYYDTAYNFDSNQSA